MSKHKILIVEDEVELAKEIADSVNNTNRYEAIISNSAREAFEVLEKNKRFLGMGENRIGCILLDVKMPEMDGLQFLGKLRDTYKEHMGVILVTAYEDDEKWLTAAVERAVGYIVKPFKEKELIDTLDRYFKGEGDQMMKETIQDYLTMGFQNREK